MEDCYYFLYSVCTKKNCVFRHSSAAKKNLIMCKLWANKKQCRVECPLRHSDYHLRKDRSDIYCYWEDTTSGCQKEFCDFKHKNPEKDEWKKIKIKTLDEIKREQHKTSKPEAPANDVYTYKDSFYSVFPPEVSSLDRVHQHDGSTSMNSSFGHNISKHDDITKIAPVAFDSNNNEDRSSRETPLKLTHECTSADLEKEMEIIDKILEEEGIDLPNKNKKQKYI